MNISGIRTSVGFYDYNNIKKQEVNLDVEQVVVETQEKEQWKEVVDNANLDVEKALSDMSKDKVLQQYHFFVGERKAGDTLGEQCASENFYL